MRTSIGALVLIGLVALTGCAAPVNETLDSAESTAPTESPLDGEWRLASGVDGTGKFALKTSITTITLTGETTGGSTACNRYSAEVIIGAGHDVTITPGAMTKVACADPALTAVETRYLTALESVIRTDIVENQLVLSNEDEKIALTYDAVPALDATTLVGINWQLESLLTGTGDDAVATDLDGGSILFNDSDFQASGGCSDITGNWAIVGGVLLLSEIDSDQTECDKALAAQEKAFAAVIGSQAIIAVEDNALTISSLTTKTGLLFRANNN